MGPLLSFVVSQLAVILSWQHEGLLVLCHGAIECVYRPLTGKLASSLCPLTLGNRYTSIEV